MTVTTQAYVMSTIEAEEWEPFTVGDVTLGEVHWVRSEGAEGAALAVGLWRSDPQSSPYPFKADETIHALDGELHCGFTVQEAVHNQRIEEDRHRA